MRDLLEPAALAIHGSGPETLAVAIGPEGGWTDAEFSAAKSAGFSEAALGINILRTETAVVRCACRGAICVRRVPSGGELEQAAIRNAQRRKREGAG